MRFGRLLASAAFLALALASVLLYRFDRREREPILAAVARFSIDVRRPLESDMIHYSPAADLGAQVVSLSVLSDTLGSVRLRSLSSAERKAWLDVPGNLGDELAAARDLELHAVAMRPGWPMHRYLLGKLVYASDRRTLDAKFDPARWIVPLGSAYRNAPGNDLVAQTLAGVLLEAWSVLGGSPAPGQPLPDTIRVGAGPAPALEVADVIRRAFLDAGFVRRALPAAVATFGADLAYRLVPDTPESLAASLDVAAGLERQPPVQGAAPSSAARYVPGLYRRWETAEWKAREDDLANAEMRRLHGDLSRLGGAVGAWAGRHRPGDFDNAAGAKQLARVLEIWPRDQVGSWGSDARTEIVKFFFDGRLGRIDGRILASTVGAMADVPAPVLARAFLAAGDVGRAENVARRSETAGSFEWTEYLVELAKLQFARGDMLAAADAVQRISPGARGECEVALVWGQVAKNVVPNPEVASLASGEAIPEARWSDAGMLSLCIDPQYMGGRSVVVDLATTGPSLVAWGWNGGRSGILDIPAGNGRITVPLRTLAGRNVLSVRTLYGGAISERKAKVE